MCLHCHVPGCASAAMCPGVHTGLFLGRCHHLERHLGPHLGLHLVPHTRPRTGLHLRSTPSSPHLGGCHHCRLLHLEPHLGPHLLELHLGPCAPGVAPQLPAPEGEGPLHLSA